MKFTINGVDQQSKVGVYAAKPTYGWSAVLVHKDSLSSTPAAGADGSDGAPMPVICAVDAKGYSFVEEGGHYVACSFADPLGGRRSKAERLADRRARNRAATRARKLQRKCGVVLPRAAAATSYHRFLGLFLQCFQNVSARDANTAWHEMSEESRRGKTAKELVKDVLATSGYLLSEDGEGELR